MGYRYSGTGTVVKKYKGNAFFYKLKEKLPLQVITKLFTAGPETKEEIPAHWEMERHWLADWQLTSSEAFESFEEGEEMEVEFEIKSTSYNSDMKQGSAYIGPNRNLNVVKLKRL